MNKKLMAAAVAGALAIPAGVAQAQSAVTISGVFHGSYQYYKIDNAAIGRLNNSQWRVTDDSSKILFNVAEDLGSGLSVIAQLDQRFYINSSVGLATANTIGSGATWVGMKSNTLGSLTIGRHDFHYNKSTQDQVDMGGALQSSFVTILDYGKNSNMYNTSRTQNSMKYTSPSFSGLNVVIGYTTSGGGNFEAGDMACAGGAAVAAVAGTTVALQPSSCTTAVAAGTNNRKGSGWSINPEYKNGPLFLGYSYLNVKPDLVSSVNAPNLGSIVINAGAPGSYNANIADQKSNQVYGSYTMGGFKIGFNYNQSEQKNASTGAQILKRTAWAIPASYSWGPHHVAGGYAKAGNNTGPAGEEASTGAKQMSIAYIYDFSKRTKVGITYSQLKNDSAATYNFYTNTSFSSQDAATRIGEKPSFWAFTFNHYF